MPGIVCAIRGGASSLPTIQKAIDLAKETGQQIHFLYVVNLDFLVATGRSRTHTIAHEMREMGEFILLKTQITAEREGVKAQGVVREGQVRKEIIEFSKEIEADYIVLGFPRGEGREDVFDHERLDEFSRQIESETGAKAVFPEE